MNHIASKYRSQCGPQIWLVWSLPFSIPFQGLCLWLTSEFPRASAQHPIHWVVLSEYCWVPLSITGYPVILREGHPLCPFAGTSGDLWVFFLIAKLAQRVLKCLGAVWLWIQNVIKFPPPNNLRSAAAFWKMHPGKKPAISCPISPRLGQSQHVMQKPENAGALAAPRPEQTMLLGSDFTHL